ncbi:unnamed protein product, partial [marine sediment metagenome]
MYCRSVFVNYYATDRLKVSVIIRLIKKPKRR